MITITNVGNLLNLTICLANIKICKTKKKENNRNEKEQFHEIILKLDLYYIIS